MAATDFRVHVGLFRSVKWRRLELRLGAEGGVALFRLWGWTREHRPTGLLERVADEDVEAIAEWAGEPGELLEAFVALGFLDRRPDGTLYVHDWHVHNAWAVNEEHRREIARRGAAARWGRKTKGDPPKAASEAGSMQRGLHPASKPGDPANDAGCYAPLPPSPLLSSPLPPKGREREGGSDVPTDATPRGSVGTTDGGKVACSGCLSNVAQVGPGIDDRHDELDGPLCWPCYDRRVREASTPPPPRPPIDHKPEPPKRAPDEIRAELERLAKEAE